MPSFSDDSLAGAPEPLQSSNSLKDYKHIELTPTIGVEFERGIQVSLFMIGTIPILDRSRSLSALQISELLKAPNSDALIRDLAILSQYTFERVISIHKR